MQKEVVLVPVYLLLLFITAKPQKYYFSVAMPFSIRQNISVVTLNASYDFFSGDLKLRIQ